MRKETLEQRSFQFVLWLVIVGAALFIWKFVPESVFKYVFLLRIPLVMGILLFSLPLVAASFLASMLKNLFVLERRLQIASTILGTTMAGIAVSFVLGIIIKGAPDRFDLVRVPIPLAVYYGLVVVLVLPTIVILTRLSKKEIDKTGKSGTREVGFGVSLGLFFDGLFLLVLDRISDWVDNSERLYSGLRQVVDHLKFYLGKIVSFISKNPEAPGYLKPEYLESDTQEKIKVLTNVNLDAFIFFTILFLVYIIFFYRFKPQAVSSRKRREAPAIFFVMLLIAIATLFLGNLTFFFDASRIPTLLFILLLTISMYWLLRVDHFFVLKPDDQQPNEATNFHALLQKRLAHQPCDEKTVVLVCASGGGIQAAGWTTQVLMGLQDVLGESFTKAIGLISGVSGGSVGTIYYLDRFTRQGFPPSSESDAIFNGATANSLDAVGWGLTYPDLWRLISLPFLPNFLTSDVCDRGIALEKNWQGEMKEPVAPKTLKDWREEVEKGVIPIPVLNATSVEDGHRLLLSPVIFPSSKNENFNCLYPKKTVDVVTAARLSATFPYVSPICRDDCNIQPLHFADGGYFDNSGFVTGLEWLKEILSAPKQSNQEQSNNEEDIQDCKLKRVLILQINPFPEDVFNDSNDLTKSKSQKRRGLFMATLGPLLALFKVRDRILNSRNFTEVGLLQRWQWQDLNEACVAQGVDVQYVPIFFPRLPKFGPVDDQNEEEFFANGEYQPPLSWKLTPSQKAEIKKGWKKIKNGTTVQGLRTLWQDQWHMN